MELFVSTTASARATAPLSLAPLHRGGSPSVVASLRGRLPARGWRCASARPRPPEEPASASDSSAVVVTDKPDSPADEKDGEELSAAPSGSVEEVAVAVPVPVPSGPSEEDGERSAAPSGSVEATVPAPVSSEPSEEGGGLDDILSKLDIEVTPALILTGSGAFVALWILFSVVSAIDSVPLLPKLLELVGIGYSIWFTSRNLIFKESRDEMFAKFEDLKQRII